MGGGGGGGGGGAGGVGGAGGRLSTNSSALSLLCFSTFSFRGTLCMDLLRFNLVRDDGGGGGGGGVGGDGEAGGIGELRISTVSTGISLTSVSPLSTSLGRRRWRSYSAAVDRYKLTSKSSKNLYRFSPVSHTGTCLRSGYELLLLRSRLMPLSGTPAGPEPYTFRPEYSTAETLGTSRSTPAPSAAETSSFFRAKTPQRIAKTTSNILSESQLFLTELGLRTCRV